jgi:hypothetical protein
VLLPDIPHKFALSIEHEGKKLLVRRLDYHWVKIVFVSPPDGHVLIPCRTGSGMTLEKALEMAKELV